MKIQPFDTDNRPIYIWSTVILTNVFVWAYIVLWDFFNYSHDLLRSISLLQREEMMWLTLALLIITIVPIFISEFKSKVAKWFGYGIPVLLLLPNFYFVWHYYHCTGKMCNMFDFLYIWASIIVAITFALFYTIGLYFRKLDIQYSRILVFVWPLLFIVIIHFVTTLLIRL